MQLTDSTARVRLLFTSDEHGHIERAPAVAGLARDRGDALLVSSGDVFQGTSVSDLQEGRPGLEVMASSRYDAVTLGNHDFDQGVTFLKDWMKRAPHPVLTSNVIEEATGQLLEGARPYVIREVDGVRVGLIGATTLETKSANYAYRTEGLQFLDPVETIARSRDELKEQGVQVIGVLSHLGEEEDLRVASEVDGLAFILGGHTHRAFEQPKVVKGTLVCQPGCYREFVGSLELEVDRATGDVVSHAHRLIAVDENTPRDPEVEALVQRAVERVREATSTVVAESETVVPFSHRIDQPFDNLLSAAMRNLTGSEAALYNRKVIRGNLPAGPVTAGDLHNALPFPNKVVKIRVSRSQVLEALKKSYEYNDHRGLVHQFLGFSPGDEHLELSLNADPVGDEVEIATTDFLAQGGLGYFTGPVQVLGEYDVLRDAVEKELDLRRLVPAEAKQVLESLKLPA